MCNEPALQAWQDNCLRKLLDLDNVEPALFIIDDASLPAFWKGKKIKSFWNIYKKLLVKRCSSAMQLVDKNPDLAHIPSLRCKFIRKEKSFRYLEDIDIAEVRKHDLDFIIYFGFDIVGGEILNAARFGVWSFRYGDGKKFQNPPGFWEIYRGECVTGAVLQRFTDLVDGGIVLKKGFLKTIDTSYTRNLDEILSHCAAWPALVCTDIQNGNSNYIDASPPELLHTVSPEPNNVQTVFFLLKIIINLFRRLCSYFFFYEHWNIGIVDSPIHVFLEPGARPDVRWLPAPAWDKFSADPFAVRFGEDLHILFEEYDSRMRKGYIVATSIKGEDITPSKIIFDAPFHMSYPYLLEHNGDIYCIPETFAAKEVSLYKAKEFPVSWEKVDTLIEEFTCADSTILQYNDRWWLFATDAEEGLEYMLKIWHAPDLFGPWEPHASNPVKVDIRSARPAGTPFFHNGNLYRPSQDCSRVYGGRIVINRVIRLTTDEFKEEQVAVIEPYKNSPYPDGLHTISAVGGMTIIDGKKHEFIGRNLSGLIEKINAILGVLLRRK